MTLSFAAPEERNGETVLGTKEEKGIPGSGFERGFEGGGSGREVYELCTLRFDFGSGGFGQHLKLDFALRFVLAS